MIINYQDCVNGLDPMILVLGMISIRTPDSLFKLIFSEKKFEKAIEDPELQFLCKIHDLMIQNKLKKVNKYYFNWL